MTHSVKFQKIKDWYDEGMWKMFQVANAVKKGYITVEEYTEITGEPYSGGGL